MGKRYVIQRKELQDDISDSASEMDEYSKVLIDIADDISDLREDLERIIADIGRGEKRKKIIKELDELICAFEMRYSRATKVQENFTHILKWLRKSREFVIEREGDEDERRST